MDKQTKVRILVNFLEEVYLEQSQARGSFECTIRIIPGFLLIVHPEYQDEPHSLEVYDEESAVEWFDNIKAYLKEYPDAPKWEAAGESRPEEYEAPEELTTHDCHRRR